MCPRACVGAYIGVFAFKITACRHSGIIKSLYCCIDPPHPKAPPIISNRMPNSITIIWYIIVQLCNIIRVAARDSLALGDYQTIFFNLSLVCLHFKIRHLERCVDDRGEVVNPVPRSWWYYNISYCSIDSSVWDKRKIFSRDLNTVYMLNVCQCNTAVSFRAFVLKAFSESCPEIQLYNIYYTGRCGLYTYVFYIHIYIYMYII